MKGINFLQIIRKIYQQCQRAGRGMRRDDSMVQQPRGGVARRAGGAVRRAALPPARAARGAPAVPRPAAPQGPARRGRARRPGRVHLYTCWWVSN